MVSFIRQHRLSLLSWLFVAVMLANIGYHFDVLLRLLQQTQQQAAANSAAPTPTPAPNAIKPPNLQHLFAQAVNNSPALTAQQEQERLRIDREQVDAAKQWLANVDPSLRIAGAQQLAAYPTPEAEKQLVKALKTDSVAEVRRTAAYSLNSVEVLSQEAIQTLFDALRDRDEDVQDDALFTLSSAFIKEERDTGRYKKLSSLLKKQLKAKSLSKEQRETLQRLIEN